MKINHTLWFTGLLALISTCGFPQVSAQTKGTYGTFTINKTLASDPKANNFGVKVEEGTGLLFEFTRHAGGDVRTDAGYTETLIFAIPNPEGNVRINSFEGKSVFFLRACRCSDSGYNQVTEGEIMLKRLDEKRWTAEIDVTASGRMSGRQYSFNYVGPVDLTNNR